MEGFKPLKHFPTTEHSKLKWLLRHADENGIVEAGVAVKFGREWYIASDKLPAFLAEHTRRKLSKSAA